MVKGFLMLLYPSFDHSSFPGGVDACGARDETQWPTMARARQFAAFSIDVGCAAGLSHPDMNDFATQNAVGPAQNCGFFCEPTFEYKHTRLNSRAIHTTSHTPTQHAS
jgi:hypothetical protein